MRYHALGRRIIFAPVIGLALITAACSSSSSSTTPSSSTSSSSSSPASAASTPAGTPASSGSSGSSSTSATSLIKTNWVQFFSGKTDAATKISLLENGQKFASVINAQAGTAIAAEAVATVTAVVLDSPTTASVTYNVGIGGGQGLNNQPGTAVLENGTWKVSDASFCSLLKLENGGTMPSICASIG
jgi:hypothetical protein